MRKSLLVLGSGFALVLSGLGTPSASAAADFGVDVMSSIGPDTLPAGLSGTYNFGVGNLGDVSSGVELFILFSGKLEQTGQITADNGFECQVMPPDTGINSAVRCTTQEFVPYTWPTITVHARGTAPGEGHLVITIDPSQAVPESSYENNFRQKDVTIT